MKKFRGLLICLLILTVCAGGVWLTLHLTAEYPALGEPVSYPVNQVPGFTLTLAEPSWSPFKGYSLRYDVAAESETVYTFTSYHSAGFEHLEQQADGQWHRLTVSPPPPEEFTDFAPLEFALGGGESHGLGGSLVQKYAGYGTRLCPGLYRLVLEMTAPDGTPHYLAAEFSVD